MKKFLITAIACISIKSSFSQQLDQMIKGHLNGSYESYSQYYMQDDKIGASLPTDRDKVGSNNFLKLDYTHGKFSAGIQYESYLPSILGYYNPDQNRVNQSKIANKYFKYSEEKFSVQIGDFYEQFGSGLVFRSYENRQIGINNALEGINIYIEPTNFTKIKALYGRTRKLFDYSNSVTRGVDAEIDVTKMLSNKEHNTRISIGGSYVGRFQVYTGTIDNYPSTVDAFATRLDLNTNNFSLNAEYVSKGKDPHYFNNNSFEKGKALLINTAFTKNNFGITLTARAIYNMDFRAERATDFATQLPVNYVPALTKQHDYLTSNIYVYSAQLNIGETGFQTDVFYNFKPNTKLGGKYGTKVSANFSYYGALNNNKDILSVGTNKYYSDANIEVKKKFSKKFETTFALQNIYYNAPIITGGHEDVLANVVALTSLYKYAPKKSIKVKLEHLWTKEDEGNWASAITEFSFSSPFAFYLSDLYNYGVSGNHYYNVGGSITKNATRFSLAFGKQRAGLFCVGGVCRFVPAAYGFTATLTTSFGN